MEIYPPMRHTVKFRHLQIITLLTDRVAETAISEFNNFTAYIQHYNFH